MPKTAPSSPLSPLLLFVCHNSKYQTFQGVIIAIFVADQSCTLAPQHGSYPLKWIQITLESRI